MSLWSQPLDPLHSMLLSAVIAAVPLAVLLILMGGLRKSGYVSAACGLGASMLLAITAWRMPLRLAVSSTAFGFVYALWPIMWIVFAALWLYNLSVATGKFDLLRRWMAEHASDDPRIQAILVAFCFGALLEGTAGFGAPVAVAAYLLVGLGFSARQAVTVSLIANTAPVAFGALGTPIIALAGVTGLHQMKLSAMVGRQLPFLSFILPSYLIWVVAGRKGLKETWPAGIVGGVSFGSVQFAVSNYIGPNAADIMAALASIVATVLFLRVWKPSREIVPPTVGAQTVPVNPGNPGSHRQAGLSRAEAVLAWMPWVLLSVVMIAWAVFKLSPLGERVLPVPMLHRGVFITLYKKPYDAIYRFQPLAAGTAALTTTLITALLLRVPLRVFLKSGLDTLRQLRLPALTVCLIVGLAYLYNYSGMAYTLGAALAGLGRFFPFVSGFLGWVACFLSGSDTASNLLFGNLQVAAARQIGVSPILLAATNSSGAVTGKMISPQNIAVGVTTVGLIGREGEVVRATFWHSIILALGLSALAFAQAYWLNWMVP